MGKYSYFYEVNGTRMLASLASSFLCFTQNWKSLGVNIEITSVTVAQKLASSLLSLQPSNKILKLLNWFLQMVKIFAFFKVNGIRMFAPLTSSFSSSFRTSPPAGILWRQHYFWFLGKKEVAWLRTISFRIFRIWSDQTLTKISPHSQKNFKDASLGRPFGPPSRRFR